VVGGKTAGADVLGTALSGLRKENNAAMPTGSDGECFDKNNLKILLSD
jgi:hypothetical protein